MVESLCAIQGVIFLLLASRQLGAVSREQIEEEMETLLLDLDPVLVDSLTRQFYLGLWGQLPFYHPMSDRIALVSDLLQLCGPGGSQMRCIHRERREVCQN